MRFLRRDRPVDGPQAADAFWAWWATARERIAAAIGDGSLPSLTDEISGAVKRVHPALAWELGPGKTAQHSLAITPEGRADLRPIALALVAAAPPPDAVWEFYSSRQPGELMTLGIAGAEIPLAEMRAVADWDDNRLLLNLRLWHPMFPSLPPQARAQVMFLFLDNLLGEDDVERWVGSIDAMDTPIEGRSPKELRDEVARRASTASDDRWTLAERTDARGNAAIVTANAALKHIDHPLALHHLLVTIDRGLDQLARSPELPELDAAEDELVTQLDGVAINAGRVTDRRQRREHFVCEDPDAAIAIAKAWATQNKHFGVRVDVAADPSWSFRGELLG